MEISVDAVVAMAPDEASVKAARGLVSPGKWPLLGADEEAVMLILETSMPTETTITKYLQR